MKGQRYVYPPGLPEKSESQTVHLYFGVMNSLMTIRDYQPDDLSVGPGKVSPEVGHI